MEKQWQLAPVAPEVFLQAHAGYAPVIAQLLYNRQLDTPAEVKAFLSPTSGVEGHDPFLFKNMEAAIALVVSHIKQGNQIVVCGDYDADGVTSSTLLAEVLRTLKAKVDVWIPSRFGEGYGLNKEIITTLHAKQVKLLITVDNGIRAKAEIAYARSLGMEVIVTDHHEGAPQAADWPDCLIINPILPGETYPFKYLCGAGVAYKFAEALITKSTLSTEEKVKLKKQLVDLAAIGTISDCVTLRGENRAIVAQGLVVINQRPRRGLRELIAVAQLVAGEITAWNISWQITPRLNAAGRIEHANAAYNLLAAATSEEAQQWAENLQAKNIERQRLTEEIMKAGIEVIEQEQSQEKLLVVLSPDLRTPPSPTPWPEGVIGLVAGRLTERFSRPSFVICQSEDKVKASGRSIEQFDIGASLEAGKMYLERYGGHKMACGFTAKSAEDLPAFISAVRAVAEQQLAGVDLLPILKIEAELPMSDLTTTFVEQIEQFAPFGQDNPEPKFVSYNVIIEEIMTMGQDKKHIKFRLGGRWAVAFGKAEAYQNYTVGQSIDVVYTVSFNLFNNRREVQLKIVDLRPSKLHE